MAIGGDLWLPVQLKGFIFIVFLSAISVVVVFAIGAGIGMLCVVDVRNGPLLHEACTVVENRRVGHG